MCINQKDDAEKSSQIPLMAEIFRDASRVMVWLGDERETVRKMKRIQTASRQSGPISKKLPAEELLELTKNVLSIVELPWFRRRWIIQELVMNPCVTFVCGFVEVAWQYIIDIINHVKEQNSHRTRSLNTRDFNQQETSDEGSSEFPSDEVSSEISSICLSSPMRTAFVLWSLWQLWSIPNSRLGQLDEAPPTSILELLHSFRNFECSDDRDRIFALIGLAQDIGGGPKSNIINFSVGYSQTIEEVYISFAEAVARAGMFSWILNRASASEPGADKGLPSWVPDWRAITNG